MVDTYSIKGNSPAVDVAADETAPSESEPDINKKRQGSPPSTYYEQLMRHDWHGKVRHRIRQRGWSR